MTQTQERPIQTTPARRRALPAAPVLIRVPAIAAGPRTPTRRVRRRRLRREFRLAGYLLIATLPLSLAFASLGGGRRPEPTATASAGGIDPTEPTPTIPGVSISLEPALAAAQGTDLVAPAVILSGHLLPADASTEEVTHGGH